MEATRYMVVKVEAKVGNRMKIIFVRYKYDEMKEKLYRFGREYIDESVCDRLKADTDLMSQLVQELEVEDSGQLIIFPLYTEKSQKEAEDDALALAMRYKVSLENSLFFSTAQFQYWINVNDLLKEEIDVEKYAKKIRTIKLKSKKK